MQGKTCCVTGHRDIPAERIDHIKTSLEYEVDRAISDGFTCFISGFADGADLLFAGIVAERIAKNPTLKLIAAIPYRRRLDTLQKSGRTKALIDLCAEIYIAAEEYHPSVYAKRNRYMVERSDRVIAVYDGREKGGTAGTIRLAHSMKKDLVEIAVVRIVLPCHLQKWDVPIKYVKVLGHK